MYLIDTDILSNLLKRAPSTDLIARLAAVPVVEQSTSSITLGEMIYGARRAAERHPRLLQVVEQLLTETLRILPFDTGAAHAYGILRADLESRGEPMGDADLRIAAIALSRDCTLVTGNVHHFARVPSLRIENWLQ